MTVTDVNDNNPEFRMPHTLNVNESAAVKSVVGLIQAEDKDVGVNARLAYSLLSNSQIFSINSSSGEIKVCKAMI